VGYESWGIEYGEIFGDPRQGDVWNRIDDLLARWWAYGNGRLVRISRTPVDTGGHNTTQVYNYCRVKKKRGVYPIKGVGGDKLPLVRPPKSQKSIEKGLFTVGVDGIKSEIVSWLKIGEPGDGYCHFPMDKEKDKDSKNIPVNGYDASYFDMLTSEKKIFKRDKRGQTRYEWFKPAGSRNESFDCRVYARAALRIMSSNDDTMLKRMDLNEPWKEQPVKNGDTVAAKKKGPVDRNARGRENGVYL
jgi:phage terminase large subunit GpA-like protein